ncbi:hypothetical protein [Streptomyces sp. SudanB182_2057]|uniref:hypothetical protein n=1 Tax=Streptomyces sp. SudanB182_2057 TaxID=3035281 RepID=UPI003F57CE11
MDTILFALSSSRARIFRGLGASRALTVPMGAIARGPRIRIFKLTPRHLMQKVRSSDAFLWCQVCVADHPWFLLAQDVCFGMSEVCLLIAIHSYAPVAWILKQSLGQDGQLRQEGLQFGSAAVLTARTLQFSLVDAGPAGCRGPVEVPSSPFRAAAVHARFQ